MTTLDGTVDLARDRELVERCQGGDEDAFAELYGRYQRRLHRFCLRRLHASDDAEEAVQEAFARAWRALPRFAGERRFYPWLTVIAGNVCTDMLRRRSRLVPMGDLPGHDMDLAGSEVDERLLRQVDLAIATEALEHLSDRHRRVLRLREGTEWSAQRIAEHEGLAAPAVDTLLWRARQAFKREFVALSEGGGLAAILGAGLAGLRRSIGRIGARLASMVSSIGSVPRGPGVIAATVAITGAAIAGGSVALVESGSGHAPAHSTTAPSAASAATGQAGAAQPSHTSGAGTPPAGTSPASTRGRTSGGTLGTSQGLGNSATGSAGILGEVDLPGSAESSATRPTPLGAVLGGIGALVPTAQGTASSDTAGAAVGSAVGGVVTTATSALTTTTSALGTVVHGATNAALASGGSTPPAAGSEIGSLLSTTGSTPTLTVPGDLAPGSSSSTSGSSGIG